MQQRSKLQQVPRRPFHLPQDSLEELVERFDVDTVALAYSDLSYDIVQSLASRANASGCKFVQLPPEFTMLESVKPVVSVCASRTGVGKVSLFCLLQKDVDGESTHDVILFFYIVSDHEIRSQGKYILIAVLSIHVNSW